MTRILIEGWRGVNHSFAMVNQGHILALLQVPGVQVLHQDLPFAMAHWAPATHGAGFGRSDTQSVEALSRPDGRAVDLAYRICSPFRHEDPACPAAVRVTFMVTEMGLSHNSFAPGAQASDAFTAGDSFIATPSTWSRDRLLEWGFAEEKVVVAHHGVDAATYRPMTSAERDTHRETLGIRPDEFVFLNLGATFWNKGVDVALLAFATLRQKHRHVRLMLKDQENVYGIGIDQTLSHLCQNHPALFGPDTLGAISSVKKNLNRAQLRTLYGVADAYVSTYRAEGFNLPVLEAMACGVPVVVTQGGSTDDFCPPELALFVQSRFDTRPPENGRKRCCYREPDLNAAIDAMERLVLNPGLLSGPEAEAARLRLTHRFSWSAAAGQMLGWAQACGQRSAVSEARRGEPVAARAAATLPAATDCTSGSELALPMV